VQDGLLIVDKPKGPTSHDVVAKLRRATGIRRIGHAGTLDPLATGVLIVLVGRATRLSGYLMDRDKSYRGTIILGVSTTTQDAEGDVVSHRDASGVTRKGLERELEGFVGTIEQMPPMVSAIKRDGTPLYELARRGVEVEREPRPVTIHSFRVTAFGEGSVDFELDCTKGTYVRTLAADLGERLGTGGYLAELRRTRVGPFGLEQAVPLNRLVAAGREWAPLGLPPLEALPGMKLVRMTETQADRVMDGGSVPLDAEQAPDTPVGLVRLSEDGRTLSAVARLGVVEGRRMVHPEKVFTPPI
jgi:tRNA pseudouridine55 synthase